MVTLTLDGSTTSGACSLVGDTVHYLATGNCVIDANQAGDASYAAAPPVQQTIAVGKTAQTITFTAPASGTVGQSAALTATVSSGLAVTFTVDPTTTNSACTLSGSTLTYANAGTCVVDAEQAGDGTYLAATQADSIPVGKASQSITFPAPSAASVNGIAVLTGTPSSGLAVTWSVDPTTTNGACSISGTTVSYLHAGTCVIDANQAGDADHNAAQVQQAVAVASDTTSASLKFSTARASFGHEKSDRISVTVRPQLLGAYPTGSVTIKASGKKICSISLSSSGSGSCALSASKLKLGKYRVIATYSGTADFQASSASKTLVVGHPATRTTLSLSTAKVTVGHEQVAHLVVSVVPVYGGTAPTGKVTITSPHLVCAFTLSHGKGNCVLGAHALKHGTYHFVATYAGSRSYAGSTSAKKTFTVK